jgi:hypothetical protein
MFQLEEIDQRINADKFLDIVRTEMELIGIQ